MTGPTRTAPELAAMIGGKFGLTTEQQRELCELPINSLETIARELAQMTRDAADEAKPAPANVFDQIRAEANARQEQERERVTRFNERLGRY